MVLIFIGFIKYRENARNCRSSTCIALSILIQDLDIVLLLALHILYLFHAISGVEKD